MTVGDLAYRRWEMRSRPPQGADADWRGAESVFCQLIEEAAYLHWLDRGQPWGDPLTDWLAAEAEICYGLHNGHHHVVPAADRRLRRQVIRETAYFRWLARGRPWGDSLTDWLTAEESVNDAESDGSPGDASKPA